MAIFNSINRKRGLLAVVVFSALGLFILSDAFGPNSFWRSESNDVGSIAGEDVHKNEMDREIDQLRALYQAYGSPEPGQQALQEGAWNNLIFDKAWKKQFDKLGIELTDAERVDMVKGRHIHDQVKNFFGGSENFSEEQVASFLANWEQYAQQNPQVTTAWLMMEEIQLPDQRLREKYLALIDKSSFVTTAEAKRQHRVENTTADIEYVKVPYFAVPDSLISVTDAELKDYMENNRDQYKVEESRSLEYVIFDINPSQEDSVQVMERLEELKPMFSEAQDDSSFVSTYSEEINPITENKPGELPAELQDKVTELSEGEVYGPFSKENSLALYKVTDIVDDTVFSARASHILFKTEGDSPEEETEVRQEAQRVLNEIKQGADFAEMAYEHGSDATASRGGDLGWFSEGRMVEEFNDAVMNASSAGLLPNLVKTDFGYHIIKVTEPKIKKRFEIAEVNKAVISSQITKELAYDEAVDFQMSVTDTASFRNMVEENEDLMSYSSSNVGKNERNLSNLVGAREVVRWAYTDAEVGDVSEVIQVDDRFVVAALTGKQEEGLPPLNDVREEVTREVMNKKKAETIKEEIRNVNYENLESLADQYGSSASFGTANDIKLSQTNIQGIGYDPAVVGLAFGLNEGEVSQPFDGQNNVVVIKLVSKNEPQEIADYSSFKQKVAGKSAIRSTYAGEVIKEKSDIEDRRYLFY